MFNVAFVCLFVFCKNYETSTIRQWTAIRVASYFRNLVRFHPSGIPVHLFTLEAHALVAPLTSKEKLLVGQQTSLKNSSQPFKSATYSKMKAKHLSLLCRGPKGHGESAGSKMRSVMDPRFSRLHSLHAAEI